MSEGLVVDHRYRLGRVVRESGVAIVYEAEHRIGSTAWIKLPRGPEHAASIVTEAKVANALGRNAIRVRDDGYTDAGTPYLVLDPVAGQRLDHWRAAAGGRAPADEALGVGDELCQAIGTMHAAGHAVGLLRADAIIVLAEGGICLLELEHTKPASAENVREDVVRVGRVLYEMLAGMPSLKTSPPLHERAPELPRAMTSAVDDASRGRFASIAELRAALGRSDSEAPRSIRRPMPSLAPEASPPSFPPPAFAALAEHRATSAPASGPHPGSQRPADVAPALRREDASRHGAPAVVERPAVANPPPPKRGPTAMILASLGALAGVTGAAALTIFVFDDGDVHPGRERAKSAVGSSIPAQATKNSSTAGAPSADSSGGRAPEHRDVNAIEIDDTAATSDVAPPTLPTRRASPDTARPEEVATTAQASPVGVGGPASGEAILRFDGDLSPRLVFVDGIIVGTTVKEVVARCGPHTVKIGGKGATRTLDLACDDARTIVVARNGTWSAP